MVAWQPHGAGGLLLREGSVGPVDLHREWETTHALAWRRGLSKRKEKYRKERSHLEWARVTEGKFTSAACELRAGRLPTRASKTTVPLRVRGARRAWLSFA